MTFKDIFPGLSRTKVIFQDFPGPGIFKKKIQDFPGGVGTLKQVYIKNLFTRALYLYTQFYLNVCADFIFAVSTVLTNLHWTHLIKITYFFQIVRG